MVIDNQIDAYFSKARIQPSIRASNVLFDFDEETGAWSGPALDAVAQKKLGAEILKKLVGKSPSDIILDDEHIWESCVVSESLDNGFFLYADEIDWDNGKLKVNSIAYSEDIFAIFFPFSDDIFISNFDDPDFEITLEGMSFEQNKIEMLLPNLQLGEGVTSSQSMTGHLGNPGRPQKWDWEGALAHIVKQAQTPDGLPTGQGAQAKIEDMIAEWFEAQTGGSPAVSQIRRRASSVMRAIRQDQ